MPDGLLSLEEEQDAHNPYGHNELVIDPMSVVDTLPSSVLAFFYMNVSSWAQRNWSRTVHALFMRDHPGADVPLVVYSPEAIVRARGTPRAAAHQHNATESLQIVRPFELAPPEEGEHGRD